MSNGVTVQVLGMRELSAKMKELGPKITRKAIKYALIKGAQVVRDEAKRQAPIATGALRKAIYIKKMNKENPFKENVILGVRHGRKMWKKKKEGGFDKGKDAFYWKWIEFGTKKMKEDPFMRPAFESKKMEAFDKIKSVLTDKIKQIVRTG